MTNIVFHGAVAMFALLFCASAQAQIYRCLDANGRPLYTDTKVGKCQLIDTGYSSPPAASKPIPAPRSSSASGGSGSASAPSPAAASTPSGFPRVDNVVQRARDDERREILGDELRIEERKLADLRKEFNNGEPERQGNERNYAKYQERVASMRDEINRTERNIEALRREIGNIR
ncbi:DUF4124 domain-containing protein [Massilia timonae]|uniref:DUF4124 domain-containing protein n=1 Tax=Massilia timonae CCUG 45783 TaxID=883126 RepID=K9DED2_9BURK|nr:DUF4124 domain-containing protein [Massilia timonae]EKU81636.1 hypothetical protein HMPREF9710_03476 [Massilia timonae CCUG 45783]